MSGHGEQYCAKSASEYQSNKKITTDNRYCNADINRSPIETLRTRSLFYMKEGSLPQATAVNLLPDQKILDERLCPMWGVLVNRILTGGVECICVLAGRRARGNA